MVRCCVFCSIVLHGVFAVRARATPSETETQPKILIVPNQQEMLVLDRYHRAFDADDMTANAVYALRSTKMLELLHTRQELKRFIGGTARARELAMDKNLTFQFRPRTCHLYLENCDPQSMSAGAEAFSNGGRFSDNGLAAFVRSPLYELHKVIFDLYTREFTYDEDERVKLVFGLIQLSALLSKLDRYIRWFARDVWRYKDILPQDECTATETSYVSYKHIGRKNCQAKLQAESDKIITTLSWYRSMIIDQYRLLITRVRYDSRSDYLYKLIYRRLEKIGFPSRRQRLQPVPNYRRLSWPADFERQLHEALAGLSKNRELRRVYPAINNYIDLAMLQALQANTAMLHELGDEIHFEPHKSNSLRSLTRDTKLWQRTRQQFGYLSPVIDFVQVEKDFQARAHAVAQQHLRQRKFSDYTVWGLGGVGLLASFNLPPLWQKNPRFATLVWLAGGLLFTGQELRDLLRSKDVSDTIARSYFGNSRDQHSLEEMQAALQLRERNMSGFIFSALLLGIDLFLLNKFTNVFGKLYDRTFGGKSPLAVSLRNRVERISHRMRRSVGNKAQVFKAVMMGENIKFFSRNPHIDRALRRLSLEWRIPRRVLDKTLFKIVPKEKLAEAIRKRTTDGHFVPYLASSTIVSLAHLTLAEWRLYGNDLKYNIDRVAVDYISSIFFSFMLSWINFGEQQQTIFAGIFKKTRANQGYLTLRERAKIFKTQFHRTLGVGFIGTFPAVSLIELNQLRTGKKTGQEALRNIIGMSIFGAAYISTLSNLRVQFLREVSHAIDGHKGLMIVLHNFNSSFGQWAWVKTKDASGAYKRGAVWGKEEYYLVKRAQTPPQRSYLFDFMNKSQHPASSLQLPQRLEQHYR